jgi:hypothetical protein
MEDIDKVVGSKERCGYSICQQKPVAVIKNHTEVEYRNSSIEEYKGSTAIFLCSIHFQSYKNQGKVIAGEVETDE